MKSLPMIKDMLKLRRMGGNRFIFLMDEKFMHTFQVSLSCIRDKNMTEIDRIIADAVHDYCWAWNKMDKEMTKDLNGKGTFEDILEKDLGHWARDHGIDLTKVVDLKCQRCGTIISRIDVMRFMEIGQEPSCPQCPGQDFRGNRLKMVPANDR